MQSNNRNNQTIYALDFDGVICDSAIETAVTGWKAARKIWSDMPNANPSQHLINDFRQVRPLLETGYEAISIMRLLYLDITVSSLSQHYQQQLSSFIQTENLKIEQLKKLFGNTRDHWIKQSPQQWLAMNPLFAGIRKQLATLSNSTWYIITTKQKRFVKQILKANKISIDDACIYAMEAQMSKQETLIKLLEHHPNQTIIFIEDRLPTLLNMSNNTQLKTIKRQLADWGYNTQNDKEKAQQHVIDLISLDQLISL
ncbi:MAG: HAD family hydrolase [Cocleimonas sp.]|nr:HAD family hydrolase [Cocleimonas sp.]